MLTAVLGRGAGVLAVAVLAALSSACTANAPPRALDHLHACASDDGPTDALCGSFDVYENREAESGRQIALRIVVLPSVGRDARPDPLVFLAGGPGQGAAELAPQIQRLFRDVQRTRDIVLVDQRGTGRSNPLNCPSSRDSLAGLTESDEEGLAHLKRCRDTLSRTSDLRQYTTTIAMDDLDDVRAYLGYEHVNLYGGSYGTRAALVYVRRHGDRVRAMVLDGVSPPDMRIPLFAARDAQRALDKMFADCEGDPSCRAAFPGLGTRVRALIAKLDATPSVQQIAHPRTGIVEEIAVRGRLVASIVFSALYSPITASILPTLLENAEHDDFKGLLALALAGEAGQDNMSVGMQLSVLCSEDSGRSSGQDLLREASGSVFSTHLMVGQVAACQFWPKGIVDPDYYAPLTSDVPTLVLSGDIDPVTPPIWGHAVAMHLPRALHLTAPGTGHGVAGTACGSRIIGQFLERGTTDDLDTSCLHAIRRPGFFLTPAGPEPLPTQKAMTR